MTDTSPVAKHIDMDQLFEINDQILDPVPPPAPENAIHQAAIEAIYTEVYAPALDRFLETRWYTVSGLKALRRDPHMLAEFVAFYKCAAHQSDEAPPLNLLAQETRLIWDLLNMCCTSDTLSRSFIDFTNEPIASIHTETDPPAHPERLSDTNTDTTINPSSMARDHRRPIQDPTQIASSLTSPDTAAAAATTVPSLSPEDRTHLIPSARLSALTSLLTHSPLRPPHLQPQPLISPTPPRNASTLTRQLHTRSLDFWSNVRHFVTASFPDPNTTTTTKPEPEPKPKPTSAPLPLSLRLRLRLPTTHPLHKCRSLLDSRENRDVIYALMRMRWLQSLSRSDDGDDRHAQSGIHLDRKWERKWEGQGEWQSEWEFGMDVLRDEAGIRHGGDGVTSGRGTNVVAMRVAAMAVRALGG